MPDVEVDDVFGVGALNADGKRFGRVKRESDKTASIGWRRWVATGQHAGMDLELEQPTVTRIEPTHDHVTQRRFTAMERFQIGVASR